MRLQQFQRIVVARQIRLIRNEFMDTEVAAATDVNFAMPHVFQLKALSEPLFAVHFSWNEVVLGQGNRRSFAKDASTKISTDREWHVELRTLKQAGLLYRSLRLPYLSPYPNR